MRRCGALLAAVAILALAASAPGPAAGSAGPTATASKDCRPVEARGRTWIVGGEGPPCRFMRIWARRYLNRGQRPQGWRCHGRDRRNGGCEQKHGLAFFVFYRQ